ncbi:GFA family protein [Paraburkholderia strydomiana]
MSWNFGAARSLCRAVGISALRSKSRRSKAANCQMNVVAQIDGLATLMEVGGAGSSVTLGEPLIRVLDLGEGRRRRRQVCSRCDTQLWGEPVDRAGMAALRPGTLLNQDRFAPIACGATVWMRGARQTG